MKRVLFLLGGLAGFSCVPAVAQQPQMNCEDPQTQIEMTMCAGEDLAEADKALNAEYQALRKLTKARDADAGEGQAGFDTALVKAQRAWVVYRDSWCEAFAYQAHGGTMEPQLNAECQAELTRKRTDELKALADNL